MNRNALIIIAAVCLVGSLGYMIVKRLIPGNNIDWENTDEAMLYSCSFESATGTVYISTRNKQIEIKDEQGVNVKSSNQRVNSEFPRNGKFHVQVRNKTASVPVGVVQHPTDKNKFTLQLQISFGPTSQDELSFDVYAVRTPERLKPYNVVVITIDTLRPDRLSAYGYSRPTSPHLEKFSEQAVRFTNAFSTTSFTPPAHASLFTSKYVADHGLLTWNRLSEEQLTLAEVLRKCGYMTAASVNLGMLTRQNLGQGFDFQIEGLRDGKEIVGDAQRLINAGFDAPYLLWLHLYDVHRPYGGPPEWVRRYNPDGREGVGDGEPHYSLWTRPHPEGYSLDDSGLSDADLQFIADRYDAGIAYVDYLLGPLIDTLSTPERLEDTMIIFTSDHGENLLEHRECLFVHDPFLYSVVTRIPLMIRFPGGTDGGTTIDDLVSIIDVAPTIMDAIGIAAPPPFQEGVSLLPLLESDHTRSPRSIFMECWGWERLTAVRSDDFLIIHNAKEDNNRFFDVAADPSEQQPADRPSTEEATRLHEALEQFRQREGTDRELPEIDPEMIEKLRALGYMQ